MKRILLVMVGAAWFMVASRAYAGPVPMPLEVDLDLASHVVIGRLTKIIETDAPGGDYVKLGLATVQVDETLKGKPAKTVEITAAYWVDPKHALEMASPPRVYKVGDEGIWVIERGGVVSHAYGLLPIKTKAEIQKKLKTLEDRKWSEPVNGLRACALVVKPDYHTRLVIIFAVKNDSDADLFVPREITTGFVAASVKDAQDKVTNYALSQSSAGQVFCTKLSPGQTIYLHPDYSSIDLAWRQELPPGKYSVLISCKNDSDGVIPTAPAKTAPVTTWKGDLSAPAVELVIEPEKVPGAAK